MQNNEKNLDISLFFKQPFIFSLSVVINEILLSNNETIYYEDGDASVRNYFNCGEDGTLTINATTGGSAQLNTLRLQSSDMPFSGIYFQGNEIHLKAIPVSGYKFDGWS